jgi:hypothetical protein
LLCLQILTENELAMWGKFMRKEFYIFSASPVRREDESRGIRGTEFRSHFEQFSDANLKDKLFKIESQPSQR